MKNRTPNFEALNKKARGMSSEELAWAACDAYEAAICAEEIEAAGLRVGKTGGYYRDEASVYRTEARRRELRSLKGAK